MATGDKNSRVLTVLEQRIDLLESVENDPKDKRTLEEQLPYSRSTVDRGVRELETFDFLRYAEDGYEPTVCGKVAAEEYRRFNRRLAILLELRPLLQWVPVSEFDLDLEWLADANLLVPEPNDPYAMVHHHVEALRTADFVRCLLPLTGQHAHEAAHENVVERGGEIEVVVESGVAETFREKPGYAALTEEMLATDRFRVFEYDGTIPFFVGIFDDETVQIGVDEDGEPRALLETETPEVHAWAEQKVGQYEKRSRPITASA